MVAAEEGEAGVRFHMHVPDSSSWRRRKGDDPGASSQREESRHRGWVIERSSTAMPDVGDFKPNTKRCVLPRKGMHAFMGHRSRVMSLPWVRNLGDFETHVGIVFQNAGALSPAEPHSSSSIRQYATRGFPIAARYTTRHIDRLQNQNQTTRFSPVKLMEGAQALSRRTPSISLFWL